MHKTIDFAVVGVGHIGKRHCSVIANNPAARLVAVVDADISLKEKIQQEYQVPFFESIENLLHSGLPIDVVNVCTPNGLHATHTIAALQAGYHVVCEKPMALSNADADAMIKASIAHDKKIFCVMQNRYSPSAVWLKEILQNNRLGAINTVVVNCFWNRDSRYYNSSAWRGTLALDGGVLYTQFSHYIDTLYWLFGDIANVTTRMTNFNHGSSIEFEDSGIAVFDFVNGGNCCFNFSTTTWDKNFVSSISIVGAEGSVRVGGQYMNEIEYCHIKDYEMPILAPSLPANDYGFYKGSAANHEFVIQNVIDHLQLGTAVTASPEEGRKVVEIIERIYQAAKSHAMPAQSL